MSNCLRKNIPIAMVIGLLLCSPFVGFGQFENKEAAKAAKLSPDLLNLEQKEVLQTKSINQKNSNLRQAAPAADDISLMKVNRTRIRNGMVAIDAIANDPDGQALLNDLQALGLQDGRYYQKIVFGYFPIDKLGLLRNVATLHVARPSYQPFKNVGKVTSQGDRVMHADIARQTYNISGAGSKIGILSDSYNALGGAPDGVASGDLPSDVQVLKDVSLEADSLLEDEGRGMAEIVHDVAPGAKIAFHTAFDSYVDFALGIIKLAKAGCNIIVDDVFYGNEPFFQDGIIAQAVDYVNKQFNVTYFSSAGNQGRQSYTSGFHNSGKKAPGVGSPGGSAVHDFGNGKITQKITIPVGGNFSCLLQWSDPFYSESVASGGVSGAKTDLDLLVYYRGFFIPELSSGYANIGDDPIEYVSITNPFNTPLEIELVILKYEGPDPSLMKWVDFTGGSIVEFDTRSSTLFGHSNAKGAIAVGAGAYYQTPNNTNIYPSLNRVFVSPPNPLVEVFSSAGGTPILFTTYGQPIPSETRLKPEISAPDGANTTFFPPIPGQDFERDGFPNFGGTSAAAPHAAGVAALLQEKSHNSLQPFDIFLRLRITALDMDDPSTPGFDTGFDFGTGFGFIQADKALMYGQQLVVLEPLYECETGKITLRTNGGDGSPITFTAPGVVRTPASSTTIAVGSLYSRSLTTYTTYTPASTTGIVEAESRRDPKNIVILAMQNGITAVYDFNFAAYCQNSSMARLASNEPGTGLQVNLMGNPIPSDWVDVEVRGVQGQALKLQVNNTLGELTSNRAVEMAESVEHHKLLLGRTPGLYFLKISTPTETKTIKVVRQ